MIWANICPQPSPLRLGSCSLAMVQAAQPGLCPNLHLACNDATEPTALWGRIGQPQQLAEILVGLCVSWAFWWDMSDVVWNSMVLAVFFNERPATCGSTQYRILNHFDAFWWSRSWWRYQVEVFVNSLAEVQASSKGCTHVCKPCYHLEWATFSEKHW